jgi:hypothetical protein
MAAFQRNIVPWRSIFARNPVGWSGSTKRRLAKVREDANSYVQTLNDRFTNPSGEGLTAPAAPEAERH